MNKEEIIEMAIQAGLPEAIIEMTPIAFETFAKMVAEHEREACADFCEKYGFDNHCGTTTDVIANAIRARGEQE